MNKPYKTQRNTSSNNQIINTLRTDNGREYANTEFAQFLSNNGIRHKTSAPRPPEQNGTAVRKNRTIIDAALTMMLATDLDGTFWAEACHSTVYIQNRITNRLVNYATPFELWFSGQRLFCAHLEDPTVW